MGLTHPIPETAMTPRLVVDKHGIHWLGGILPGIWIMVPGT